jgi:HlyD family secretion protein
MNYSKIYKQLKFFLILGLFILVSGSAWLVFKKFFTAHPKALFHTQKIEKRDIYNIVSAEGFLEAQGSSKLGPLITGTIKHIFVQDSDVVEKGKLLALLDNGYGGDTRVRQRAATLEKSKIAWDFAQAHFQRRQALFESGQLAPDIFEQERRDYETARADVALQQALYDEEVVNFENTKIIAPHDGTILSSMKEGEAVSPIASVPSILFEIAKNLTVMRVTLNIDENKIGKIKIGQKAKISVDTYPYRMWKGVIDSVGSSPFLGTQAQKQFIAYKTLMTIKNDEKLLRPGMTVHAKITVEKAKAALSLPGYVFQMNSKMLEQIAKASGYAFKPLEPATKKELLKRKGEKTTEFLWVVQDKSFIEKAVEVGITDNAYFQIIAGVTEQEDIIHGFEPSDEMKALMKKLVGGGL